jgi:hydrogenase maturation protease
MLNSMRDNKDIRVLVAGVGNRLMGDDGFGPRVIDLLLKESLPMNVEARDIGTAGLTIATDLADYDLVIFLDSMEMEGEPGRLYKAKIEVLNTTEEVSELAKMTLHEVGLEGLLKFARAINTLPERVILIGCKPKDIHPTLELSQEVEAATLKAARMVLATLESDLSRK